MPYGIMRVEKRKRTAVYGLQIEANRSLRDHKAGRDFQRSDIDWRRTGMNYHLIKTENWMERINELTDGLRMRKDSVLLLDGLYTASPEFFEQADAFTLREYWEDCLNFHIKEYCGGDKSLIINAVVHLDETTPHLQIASVPIIQREDGTRSLSAKEIMGNATIYRQHQDKFYENVSRDYGMERGERSDVEHKRKHLNKLEYAIAEKQKELETLERRAEEATMLEEQAMTQTRVLLADVERSKLEKEKLEKQIIEADRDYRIRKSRLDSQTRYKTANTPEERVMLEYIDFLKKENQDIRLEAKKAGLSLKEHRFGGREERPRVPIKSSQLDR